MAEYAMVSSFDGTGVRCSSPPALPICDRGEAGVCLAREPTKVNADLRLLPRMPREPFKRMPTNRSSRTSVPAVHASIGSTIQLDGLGLLLLVWVEAASGTCSVLACLCACV